MSLNSATVMYDEGHQRFKLNRGSWYHGELQKGIHPYAIDTRDTTNTHLWMIIHMYDKSIVFSENTQYQSPNKELFPPYTKRDSRHPPGCPSLLQSWMVLRFLGFRWYVWSEHGINMIKHYCFAFIYDLWCEAISSGIESDTSPEEYTQNYK